MSINMMIPFDSEIETKPIQNRSYFIEMNIAI